MLPASRIIFHAELKTLLPAKHQASGVTSSDPARRASIKDIIESLGVPHTEVGCIIHLGQEVGFEYIPQPGQVLHVHAPKPPVDIKQATLLRPRPLQEPRFLVDVNVGKLARLLRMLGLDTAFDPCWEDAYIAELAWEEGRIVLSRDKGLLKRKKVEFGRLLRSNQPLEQLQEVLHFFGLGNGLRIFTRCLRCNSELQEVDKQSIQHLLLPKTKKYYQEFCICPGCSRIYWQGSHLEKMQNLLQRLQLDHTCCRSPGE
ncbi:MAG: Mut7-C RNAse domain-containing protein [Desulfohalobiaceae bacterium]